MFQIKAACGRCLGILYSPATAEALAKGIQLGQQRRRVRLRSPDRQTTWRPTGAAANSSGFLCGEGEPDVPLGVAASVGEPAKGCPEEFGYFTKKRLRMCP